MGLHPKTFTVSDDRFAHWTVGAAKIRRDNIISTEKVTVVIEVNVKYGSEKMD